MAPVCPSKEQLKLEILGFRVLRAQGLAYTLPCRLISESHKKKGKHQNKPHAHTHMTNLIEHPQTAAYCLLAYELCPLIPFE